MGRPLGYRGGGGTLAAAKFGTANVAQQNCITFCLFPSPNFAFPKYARAPPPPPRYMAVC